MADTEIKALAVTFELYKTYDLCVTLWLDRNETAAPVHYVWACRHTKPQSMQTQKALAYLVENVLLLFGIQRGGERAEAKGN